MKLKELEREKRAESQSLCILAQRHSKEYNAILKKRKEILKKMEGENRSSV